VTEPLVSVVIPTYNRAHLLPECLDSVLSQDFGPFEIIVVDDGSTDNTSEVLARYGDRVISVRQSNTGVAGARNLGVRVARGALVAFHDSDDKMLPGRLAAQVAFMEAHPEVAAVTGNIVVQGSEPINYLKQSGLEFGGRPYLILERAFEKLFDHNFMANPASMLRRDRILDAGGYDVSLRCGEDYDLWLRMARRWPLAAMDFPCTWVRQHAGSLTVTSLPMAYLVKIMDRAFNTGEPLGQRTLERVMRRYARRVWGYIQYNLMERPEPDWQAQARYFARRLSWPRRLGVGLLVGLPPALLRFVLRLFSGLRAVRKRARRQ